MRSAVQRKHYRAEGRIDLVKVDTEDSETALVDAIPSDIRQRIGQIVYENNDGTTRWL